MAVVVAGDRPKKNVDQDVTEVSAIVIVVRMRDAVTVGRRRVRWARAEGNTTRTKYGTGNEKNRER